MIHWANLIKPIKINNLLSSLFLLEIFSQFIYKNHVYDVLILFGKRRSYERMDFYMSLQNCFLLNFVYFLSISVLNCRKNFVTRDHYWQRSQFRHDSRKSSSIFCSIFERQWNWHFRKNELQMALRLNLRNDVKYVFEFSYFHQKYSFLF